jgi:adenylate cyclase, class 2
MHLEVEQKFRVASLAEVRQRLVELGTVFAPSIEQADTYFAHPARDFARTDEALRLRRVGETNYITYKGPKLDRETKTRRELELPLPAGTKSFDQYTELLLALGFGQVATVLKRREPGRLTWDGLPVEIALDMVEGLGDFVELEIATNDSSHSAAKSAIAGLGQQLGLGAGERRSYLELLLAGSS